MSAPIKMLRIRHLLQRLPDLTEYPYVNRRLEKVEGILLEQMDLEEAKDLLTEYLKLLHLLGSKEES